MSLGQDGAHVSRQEPRQRPENRYRRHQVSTSYSKTSCFTIPNEPRRLGSRSGAHMIWTGLDNPQPTGGLEVELMPDVITLICFFECSRAVPRKVDKCPIASHLVHFPAPTNEAM